MGQSYFANKCYKYETYNLLAWKHITSVSQFRNKFVVYTDTTLNIIVFHAYLFTIILLVIPY